MRSSLVAVVLSCLAAFAAWWGLNPPVEVGNDFHGKLRSMSYAPYRSGQSPLDRVYPGEAQLDEDMRLLSQVTEGVRVYTSREGLDQLPPIAAKYGMNVTASAWLDAQPALNAVDIKSLIELANKYPETIKRVIVGNEVLLRRDLKPDQLIAYIKQVRAAVKQPVSYADVWAFWLKYPEVAEAVDYITIHILPYWEDEPVAIDEAAEHLAEQVAKIRAAFPGKPILIGESGWPTDGRNRGPAVTSIENGARFARLLPRVAEKLGVDYNVVEAFDQEWKSALEGTIGAKWGIYGDDRSLKFPLAGPVPPARDWPLRAGLAVVLGAVAALWLGRGMGLGRGIAFALLCQLMAALAVETAFGRYANAFSMSKLAFVWANIALSGAMALGILRAAAGRQDRWLPWLTAFLAAMAVIYSVLLAYDGRYRDIPVLHFLVPSLGVVALGLWGGLNAITRGLPRRLVGGLALALILAAVYSLIGEGLALIGEDFQKEHPTLDEQVPLIFFGMFANREILLWCLLQLLFALPFATAWSRSSARVPQRASA